MRRTAIALVALGLSGCVTLSAPVYEAPRFPCHNAEEPLNAPRPTPIDHGELSPIETPALKVPPPPTPVDTPPLPPALNRPTSGRRMANNSWFLTSPQL